MVELGDLVKDSVSGFKGVAVSRHSYLQGCDRISVQPLVKKDGTHIESIAFDEPQLIVLKKKQAKRQKGDPGGPMPYCDTPKPE